MSEENSKLEKKAEEISKKEIVKKRKELIEKKAQSFCCPMGKTPGLSILKGLFVALLVFLAFSLLSGKRGFLGFGAPSSKLNQSQSKSSLNNTNNKSVRDDQLVVPSGAQAEEDAVVQVVEKSSPGVVSIIISKDMPKIQNYFFDPFGGGGGMGGFDSFGSQGPSPFDQFFGGNQGNPDNQGGGTKKVEIGGGSGFVVSQDGLIVTNRHVVEDQTADYTVLTNDGREYEAKVLGRDRTNDVAVIKITPDKPTKGKGVDKMDTLPLGDSSSVKIGQTVIAIGNALGEFRNTVSKGIISGLSRNLTAGGPNSMENLDELIQTDAAINQGNSGGPLLNLKGEVVGINVAIAAGAQNVGFSLPINSVKNVIDNVEKNGKIVQPYLGVRYVPINSAMKENNNLPFDYGVLVLRGNNPSELAVIPGSPADKAGILENDIILEVNGTKVDEKNSLVKIISNFVIGQEIELKVWRKGQEEKVKVTLQESPSK